MPRFQSLSDDAEKLLAIGQDYPAEVRAFLWRVLMCRQDMDRYQWIRCQFAVKDIGSDGTYRPIWPVKLPRAESLDQSVDMAMRKESADE